MLASGFVCSAGIYRISVPFHAVPMLPEGFTFNQFLLVDEKPLLWHTGMKVCLTTAACQALETAHHTQLAVPGPERPAALQENAVLPFTAAADGSTQLSTRVDYVKQYATPAQRVCWLGSN